MKFWVDYTNWRGRREWREIEAPRYPMPPLTSNVSHDIRENFVIRFGEYVEEHQPEKTTFKRPKIVWTMVMDVAMIDREGARRTLRVDHIHGFAWQSAKPSGKPWTGADAESKPDGLPLLNMWPAADRTASPRACAGPVTEAGYAAARKAFDEEARQIQHQDGLIADPDGYVLGAALQAYEAARTATATPAPGQTNELEPADPKELQNTGDPIRETHTVWPFCGQCGVRHEEGKHPPLDKLPAIRDEQRRGMDMATEARRSSGRVCRHFMPENECATCGQG